MGQFRSLRRVIVGELSNPCVDTPFVLTLLCGSALIKLVFNRGVVREALVSRCGGKNWNKCDEME